MLWILNRTQWFHSVLDNVYSFKAWGILVDRYLSCTCFMPAQGGISGWDWAGIREVPSPSQQFPKHLHNHEWIYWQDCLIISLVEVVSSGSSPGKSASFSCVGPRALKPILSQVKLEKSEWDGRLYQCQNLVVISCHSFTKCTLPYIIFLALKVHFVSVSLVFSIIICLLCNDLNKLFIIYWSLI